MGPGRSPGNRLRSSLLIFSPLQNPGKLDIRTWSKGRRRPRRAESIGGQESRETAGGVMPNQQSPVIPKTEKRGREILCRH